MKCLKLWYRSRLPGEGKYGAASRAVFFFIKIDRIPFDDPAARKYSIIRTRLEKGGIVISERDLQIASIAVENKLIVVTHNVKEFKRIRNLDVEDWADEPGR